jgi:hypothetical protein
MKVVHVSYLRRTAVILVALLFTAIIFAMSAVTVTIGGGLVVPKVSGYHQLSGLVPVTFGDVFARLEGVVGFLFSALLICASIIALFGNLALLVKDISNPTVIASWKDFIKALTQRLGPIALVFIIALVAMTFRHDLFLDQSFSGLEYATLKPLPPIAKP